MIRLEDVSFYYQTGDEQIKAVDQINMTIREGESFNAFIFYYFDKKDESL